MSDDEPFLARWSRRKREAAEEGVASDAEAAPAVHQDVPPAPDPEVQSGGADAPGDASAEFDASALPPIESIAADTDIRAYLARGVPEDLARAALRRAWTSDPAIRDFVGIAENQWDFTAPDGVPGFGAIEMTDQMRRLIADAIGDMASSPRASVPDASHPPAGGRSEGAPQVAARARQSDRDQASVGDPGGPADEAGPAAMSDRKPGPASGDAIVQSNKTDVVSQREPDAAEESPVRPRRSRGRALPV